MIIKKQFIKTFTKEFIKVMIISIVFSALIYIPILNKYYINNNTILQKKETEIIQLKEDYTKLKNDYEKNLAITKAISKELKRISNELKEYTGASIDTVDIKTNTKEVLKVISNYIQKNESFSDIPYCDSDGKYHNGYGTVAKMINYNVGEKITVRNCLGKKETITVTSKDLYFPEASITKEEALLRKREHIKTQVFPYLYDKKFNSIEELIVATDVIYNRGIGQTKRLFTKTGTIDCKALYNYMYHSNAKYKNGIIKRYAKNYALCIQS